MPIRCRQDSNLRIFVSLRISNSVQSTTLPIAHEHFRGDSNCTIVLNHMLSFLIYGRNMLIIVNFCLTAFFNRV